METEKITLLFKDGEEIRLLNEKLEQACSVIDSCIYYPEKYVLDKTLCDNGFKYKCIEFKVKNKEFFKTIDNPNLSITRL